MSRHAAAAEACEKARHTYGARVESGADATSALAALTQAEGHIRACESALSIAKEKDQHAHTELLNAKREAAIEKEVEALAHLKFTVAPKVDDLIAQLELVATELAVALNHAHGTGAGGLYNSLARAKPELARFVGRAVDSVTGMGYVAERMMGFARWSDCIPDPDKATIMNQKPTRRDQQSVVIRERDPWQDA